MGKRIQLNIADPCHESWENMTLAEKGRFCLSCQKQVVDFTQMSDTQLAAYFKNPSAGSTCGRFFSDQLDREIEIPKKRIPWVKYFFQFAIPAFLISARSSAQGTIRMGKLNPVVSRKLATKEKDGKDTIPTAPGPTLRIPEIEDLSIDVSAVKHGDMTTCIAPNYGTSRIVLGGISFKPRRPDGVVVNEKGYKIEGALLKAGDDRVMYSDNKGRFYVSFLLRDNDSAKIYVSKAGYREQEAMLRRDSRNKVVITLQSEPKELTQDVAVTSRRVVLRGPKFFRLSPNPVQRNDLFYIELDHDKSETMQVSVFDLAGALITTCSQAVTKGYNRLSILADGRLTAGVYVLQLINQSGQIIKKDKLVVQ